MIVEIIGSAKQVDRAAHSLGEAVEAVTTVGEHAHYASQMAKGMLTRRAQKMMTLVVTNDRVLLFEPGFARHAYDKEVFSGVCREITRILRKPSWTGGGRFVIIFADGEQLRFRAIEREVRWPELARPPELFPGRSRDDARR